MPSARTRPGRPRGPRSGRRSRRAPRRRTARAIRRIGARFRIGMIPGRIGMSAPTPRRPLDQAGVVGGPEEHLGDRELRAGVGLGHQHARRRGRGLGAPRWPSGNAATPIRKPRPGGPARPAPRRRSGRPSVGVHGVPGPSGGSPRSASTLRTPGRGGGRRGSPRAPSRVCPTQVRWPIGSSEVSRAIRPVIATVVSRVVPPAPYVTETNVG